jgi:hypothetical protein
MNIYPNPASNAVNIDFNIPDKTLLRVFDTLGKQVSKQKFDAGKHHFTWANPESANSVYYFNLTDSAGKLIESRKVIFQ